MASRTSTETRREITTRGDVVIIKEVEKTTTYEPGKKPVVKEVTRVQEFQGEEGFKRLPENIRCQLGGWSAERAAVSTAKGHGGSGSSGSGRATGTNFAEECLDEHNKYRKIHGVEPLKLSSELIRVSEERARELASEDKMTSRSDDSYGENLSCMWSSDPEHTVQAGQVVTRWYSEANTYNYDDEPNDLNAGHFTQMIWKSSKEFGIAAAKSRSNRIYVVASYKPPGNYIGQFKSNVLPAGSASVSSSCIPETNSNVPMMDFHVATGGPNDSDKMSQLNREGLNYHNEYRAKHGVPPLSYSERLSVYAQEWAENLSKLDRLEHRRENQYGENLYCFKSSSPSAVATAAQACKSWYNEIRHHNFDSDNPSMETGHFTQMVWRTTRELGMGMAKSKSGLQIIVANYNPPGNYIGRFRANVPKPSNL